MIGSCRCTTCLSLTFVVFVSVGCFSLVGDEPEASPRKAALGIHDTLNSGLEGTTRSEVISGMPGGMTTGHPASVEFAIAPLEGGKPALAKAIFVHSDRDGKYRVTLPPGEYWIGSKRKALGATNLPPSAVEFRETKAVVTEDVFAHLDLLQISYAP